MVAAVIGAVGAGKGGVRDDKVKATTGGELDRDAASGIVIGAGVLDWFLFKGGTSFSIS